MEMLHSQAGSVFSLSKGWHADTLVMATVIWGAISQVFNWLADVVPWLYILFSLKFMSAGTRLY